MQAQHTPPGNGNQTPATARPSNDPRLPDRYSLIAEAAQSTSAPHLVLDLALIRRRAATAGGRN